MQYPADFESMLVNHAAAGNAPPPSRISCKKKRPARKGLANADHPSDEDKAGSKHAAKKHRPGAPSSGTIHDKAISRSQGGFSKTARDVFESIQSSINTCLATSLKQHKPQIGCMSVGQWDQECDEEDGDDDTDELDLSSIIKGTSYLETFYRIFNTADSIDEFATKAGSNIMAISRATEELYMREPIHQNERRCVNGSLCHCMTIDQDQPFVAVEFVCPWEDSSGPRQMCVLCHRALVQELLYSISGPENPVHPVIQRYGNICGVPGEYKESACNTSIAFGNPSVLPLPLAVYQKSAYVVERINGYKHIRQDAQFYFF